MSIVRDKPVVGIVLVVIAIAAAAFMFRPKPSPVSTQSYFYDLSSGEVFAADKQPPPIDAPSGGQAVQAAVYSCGACEPGAWTVAWLETYDGPAEPQHHRVAAVPEAGGEPRWMSMVSNEAGALTNTPNTMCDGGAATACTP